VFSAAGLADPVTAPDPYKQPNAPDGSKKGAKKFIFLQNNPMYIMGADANF
jgi:hypothetical protein